MYTIVGLGNPGEAYEHTRHNIGRQLVESFAETHGFSDWKEHVKPNHLVAAGDIGAQKARATLPDTFMNKSGSVVAKYVSGAKQSESLIVVHDDLDLPLGALKISFGRGSGGHRGVESVARSIKTKNFVRVRVGISPQTPSGKLRKPKGERNVEKWILGDFSKKEIEILNKKMRKRAHDALASLITDGRAKAMNVYN